ncbi:SDR family NAD(P)-dependent oxidoreductase [Aquibacillus rhizosphaerae]|uniref:SDR family oxidoreductase n=1 Tax=Aquibacillus rhizosphaerae TaxID=3051431 RepID=A0ABT7L3L3_9BACI|nr:SDR family oxidoreductase [Aquibacillus sp. LR5S19]MDL4839765.1 SDR family oxidoreductase [Aquibacillus sp. LR5S19]
MDLKLKKKKVLVTGGARGIGKAIAAAFIKEGAHVGIVARNQEELKTTQEELGVQIYSKDLSKQEQREELINDFIRDFKRIDILINNAGASFGKDSLTTPVNVFDESMKINFFSAVHLSQLVSKQMVSQGEDGGVIINVSSIYGRESGGSPSYNASKAALISFTKSFSTEAIKNKIRVVGIAPGATYHPNKEWIRRLENDPDFLKKYAADKIPSGRLGETEDIANVAVFLGSDNASWIVGTTIPIDGGQSRMNF